jgi:hypothetical protein
MHLATQDLFRWIYVFARARCRIIGRFQDLVGRLSDDSKDTLADATGHCRTEPLQRRMIIGRFEEKIGRLSDDSTTRLL